VARANPVPLWHTDLSIAARTSRRDEAASQALRSTPRREETRGEVNDTICLLTPQIRRSPELDTQLTRPAEPGGDRQANGGLQMIAVCAAPRLRRTP
jgi:hypothetical protein